MWNIWLFRYYFVLQILWSWENAPLFKLTIVPHDPQVWIHWQNLVSILEGREIFKIRVIVESAGSISPLPVNTRYYQYLLVLCLYSSSDHVKMPSFTFVGLSIVFWRGRRSYTTTFIVQYTADYTVTTVPSSNPISLHIVAQPMIIILLISLNEMKNVAARPSYIVK